MMDTHSSPEAGVRTSVDHSLAKPFHKLLRTVWSFALFDLRKQLPWEVAAGPKTTRAERRLEPSLFYRLGSFPLGIRPKGCLCLGCSSGSPHTLSVGPKHGVPPPGSWLA